MDIPDNWNTGTVEANGIEIHYYRVGRGKPLVMAHGFYDNGQRWAPLGNDLAENYDVIMYDARGHGKSDAPESGYTINDRVDDLVGLVEALELENPILLGHSMGASTVAWAAEMYPDLPHGIVLEDPVGMYKDEDMKPEERLSPEERYEITLQKLEEASEKSVDELVEEYDDRDPEQARRLAVATTECSPKIAEIARKGYPQLKDAFQDIESPTLILKRDAEIEKRIMDLDSVEELQKGRIVHVPDTGHYVFADGYDAAFIELQVFLQRLD